MSSWLNSVPKVKLNHQHKCMMSQETASWGTVAEAHHILIDAVLDSYYNSRQGCQEAARFLIIQQMGCTSYQCMMKRVSRELALNAVYSEIE